MDSKRGNVGVVLRQLTAETALQRLDSGKAELSTTPWVRDPTGKKALKSEPAVEPYRGNLDYCNAKLQSYPLESENALCNFVA